MLYRDAYRSVFSNNTESVETRFDAMRPWQLFVKRAGDIFFSFCGLILLSPLMTAIAIILKCKGERNVIYSQERIGYGGKPFTIYKFKTFNDEAEPDGPQLSSADDTRITPVGRVLREHHLDELPQLWNVLKGDMSLVGPRPERKYFIDKIMKYDSRYKYLYRLRPGVTSDATLHNGYTDTMEKMLKRLDRDLYYLENRTLSMDFKIIVETAISIIICKKF
jgi:lipopolysaccharide/colanic/teichoic acid biosynthesis glycosyltransferase